MNATLAAIGIDMRTLHLNLVSAYVAAPRSQSWVERAHAGCVNRMLRANPVDMRGTHIIIVIMA